MKIKVVSLIIASMFCLSGCGVLTLQAKEMTGQPAPEARLMLLDGTEFPLSSLQGKYTAIVFWATWCPKSRKLIVRYEELARRYSQRGDIEFYAVSVDKNEDFGKLKDRIKSQDLKTMTHIFTGNDSQDDVFLSFKGNSVPYLVLIDPKGTIRVVDDSFDTLDDYMNVEFGY